MARNEGGVGYRILGADDPTGVVPPKFVKGTSNAPYRQFRAREDQHNRFELGKMWLGHPPPRVKGSEVEFSRYEGVLYAMTPILLAMQSKPLLLWHTAPHKHTCKRMAH